MIAACTERFERRLVEEVSGLRVQIVQVESAIRQDMAQQGARLRAAIAQQGATLREEMATLGSTSGKRWPRWARAYGRTCPVCWDEIAATRVNLFKWCFLCWVGQLLAIGGLLAVMLRLTR